MPNSWIWQHANWPSFSWKIEELAGALGQARRAQGRLDGVRDPLSADLSREALGEILKAEGISTSAIEGQILNPASVADSVARHLGLARPNAAPLSLDAEGLISVLVDAGEACDVDLDRKRLLAWQKALFPAGGSVHPGLLVGQFRQGEVSVQSGVIGRETIHFLAVPGSRLEAELDLFINWFNKSRGAMDGLLRAGITHFWLVTLHPFEDGNGRVTRALTDMAIAQDEGRPDSLFRMSSRILEVRKEYYAALQAGQAFGNGQDLTPWLGWFLHQAEMACAGAEQTIRRTLAKARFWATHREDPVNERQRKVLNALLDAGPGGVVGGLTTGKYRGMAKASPATAFRDINDLLAAGCIVQNPGGGRSTSYDIPWESLFA